jgi:hypothetical protein
MQEVVTNPLTGDLRGFAFVTLAHYPGHLLTSLLLGPVGVEVGDVLQLRIATPPRTGLV